jgi:hypothetical protein
MLLQLRLFSLYSLSYFVFKLKIARLTLQNNPYKKALTVMVTTIVRVSGKSEWNCFKYFNLSLKFKYKIDVFLPSHGLLIVAHEAVG